MKLRCFLNAPIFIANTPSTASEEGSPYTDLSRCRYGFAKPSSPYGYLQRMGFWHSFRRYPANAQVFLSGRPIEVNRFLQRPPGWGPGASLTHGDRSGKLWALPLALPPECACGEREARAKFPLE